MDNGAQENQEQINPPSPEETPPMEAPGAGYLEQRLEETEAMGGTLIDMWDDTTRDREKAKEKREFRDRCIIEVWITLLNMGADPKTIYQKTADITAKLITVRDKVMEAEDAYSKQQEKKKAEEEE